MSVYSNETSWGKGERGGENKSSRIRWAGKLLCDVAMAGEQVSIYTSGLPLGGS